MTTTSSIATYLQYANLQMAAEAFLTDASGNVITTPEALIPLLKKGKEERKEERGQVLPFAAKGKT